jgi:hypothetical protein
MFSGPSLGIYIKKLVDWVFDISIIDIGNRQLQPLTMTVIKVNSQIYVKFAPNPNFQKFRPN